MSNEALNYIQTLKPLNYLRAIQVQNLIHQGILVSICNEQRTHNEDGT
jgi:hypothetical protein